MERTYRRSVNSKGLTAFQVAVKQTDLWISAKRDLSKEARDLVLDCRAQLELYISQYPAFRSTLIPWPNDPFAPPLVKEMITVGQQLSVGPMACVAGAIAQRVGEGLLEWTTEVVVENGGDIYANAKRDLTVAMLSANRHIGRRIGIKIVSSRMPISVCSSSATLGHSYSEGSADLVTVIAGSAAYADGAATAICNMIKTPGDLQNLDNMAAGFDHVVGILATIGKTMACWGDVELVSL